MKMNMTRSDKTTQHNCAKTGQALEAKDKAEREGDRDRQIDRQRKTEDTTRQHDTTQQNTTQYQYPKRLCIVHTFVVARLNFGKSWKIFFPRLGPLTVNFWSVLTFFQLSRLGRNFRP